MRESIVCTGRVGKEPYRFPETGTPVFSYEEICYYLSGHMLFYLYTLPEEELLSAANQWELSHGGISGRTAQQFINYLAGKETPHADA